VVSEDLAAVLWGLILKQCLSRSMSKALKYPYIKLIKRYTTTFILYFIIINRLNRHIDKAT
jgi:hypothetical protein